MSEDSKTYFASYYDGDDGLIDIVINENYNRFRIASPEKIPCLSCGDQEAFVICGPCVKFVRDHHSRENQKAMYLDILSIDDEPVLEDVGELQNTVE